MNNLPEFKFDSPGVESLIVSQSVRVNSKAGQMVFTSGVKSQPGPQVISQ